MHDRGDEIAGYGPGLALAVGLGMISGIATVAVLVLWLQVAGIAGTFQSASGGIWSTAGWWVVFWLALSSGLLASLWIGFRVWRIAYPVKQRHDVVREEREAVAAAEAIVEAARSSGTPGTGTR